MQEIENINGSSQINQANDTQSQIQNLEQNHLINGLLTLYETRASTILQLFNTEPQLRKHREESLA